MLLAKLAGMKYLCFTAKHHHGFCMWDTQYNGCNSTNTPYGKDILKLFADACRKHDILHYFNPDLHHPYGYNPASPHQWKAIAKCKHRNLPGIHQKATDQASSKYGLYFFLRYCAENQRFFPKCADRH